MMMMASRKIIFSPHKLDLFLVGGYGINDLRLYQGRVSNLNIAANTVYDQVATPLRFVDIPLTVKTFDWSHHTQYADLIGLGLTNGKTILLRMGFDSSSSFDERQDEKRYWFSRDFAVGTRLTPL
jgi:hypothetical protein